MPEEFQMVGAATGKLRRPSSVLVRGTSMSRRSAERWCARPELDVYDIGSCLQPPCMSIKSMAFTVQHSLYAAFVVCR